MPCNAPATTEASVLHAHAELIHSVFRLHHSLRCPVLASRGQAPNMSGRSAYVRRKTQDPSPSPSKSKSSAGSSRDSHSSASTGDYPYYPTPSVPIGTGIGTTNARLLKFSDSTADIGLEATSPQSPTTGWDGYYAQEGRLRTEDVSGIEKSGLRSAIDRRSDDVRKGIARTLTFGKKGKDEKGKGKGKEREEVSSPEPGEQWNSTGGAPMRRGTYPGPEDQGYAPRHHDYGVDHPGYQQQPLHPRRSQLPESYDEGYREKYHPPPQSPGLPRPGVHLHPWDTGTPPASPPPSRELPPLPPHAQPRR